MLWHSLLFRSCDSFFWSTAISCWASLLCFLQICCMITYVCCVTGALCVLSKWLKHLCLASGCFATMSWPARQPEHNISKVQEKPTKDGKFIVPRWETEPAGGIMGEALVVLFFHRKIIRKLPYTAVASRRRAPCSISPCIIISQTFIQSIRMEIFSLFTALVKENCVYILKDTVCG